MAGTDSVLVSIDAGTSVLKAVAFDLAGGQLAVASRRNHYRQLADGGVEQDMRRTWRDTAAVLAELGQLVPELRRRALALAVTGQGDGTWLVDADGEPVHDGWLWLDARAASTARELDTGDRAEVIYRQTGTGITGCQMRSQLLWMRQHAPELLRRAATALHCKDWLHLCLTGIRATDPSEATFTFGDFRTGDYCEVTLAALGLADLRRLLPPIVDGSRQSHPLTAAAAAATGLPAGLPVVLGWIDAMCSAIGTGIADPVARPGLSVLGSTGLHVRQVPDADAVVLNAARSGYTIPLPGGGLAQMQSHMAATLNLDWVLALGTGILHAEGIDRDPLAWLEALAPRIRAARPGAALFHPYISTAGERGPFTDPDARASLTGLDRSTGWIDLLRAVHDGIVLAARDCYHALGRAPDEIRLTGGGARSPLLRGLLAAAMNRPVRTLDRAEAGAAGAAMIAATERGVFPDLAAATRVWVDPLLAPAEPPDPALVPVYDRLYRCYRESRRHLAPLWAAQAALARTDA